VGAAGSDKHGEFKLENLMPGHYIISPFSESNNWRAESLTFEIVDRDLTGLEIKTTRGASVSGVVIVKNSDEKSVAGKFDRFHVYASVQNPSNEYGGARVAHLGSDGSFKIVGLPPGNIRLDLVAAEYSASEQFTVVSIDHNGTPLANGIELKEGEQIEGIRIFVRNTSFTGGIRGQIKFENGEPPPASRIFVFVALLDENRTPPEMNLPAISPSVDSRGRFMLQHLAGGTYEISVGLYQPTEPTNGEMTKRQVIVTNGSVTDVTIPIKLKP
jgi:hypothetical protein